MSDRILQLSRHLRRIARKLEACSHYQAVKPEEGKLYRTFNGSVVYVLELDETTKEGRCIVLKGGHKTSPARGELPGENYVVNEDGWYSFGVHDNNYLTIELVMSLMEMIPVDLDVSSDMITRLDSNESFEISEVDQLAIQELLENIEDKESEKGKDSDNSEE